jgi:hypothetical protein
MELPPASTSPPSFFFLISYPLAVVNRQFIRLCNKGTDLRPCDSVIDGTFVFCLSPTMRHNRRHPILENLKNSRPPLPGPPSSNSQNSEIETEIRYDSKFRKPVSRLPFGTVFQE